MEVFLSGFGDDGCCLEGFGYWSGRDVRVEFWPAAPNTGIVFVRDDLPSPVEIPGTIEHLTKRVSDAGWNVTS